MKLPAVYIHALWVAPTGPGEWSHLRVTVGHVTGVLFETGE